MPEVVVHGSASLSCTKVTYDDGSMELGVKPQQLRSPEEVHRGVKGGAQMATGPFWEQQAVRPAIGVRVAVHGHCAAQLSTLVVGMIAGKFIPLRETIHVLIPPMRLLATRKLSNC